MQNALSHSEQGACFMKIMNSSLAGTSTQRLFLLLILCFALSLAACVKSGTKGSGPVNPNDKQLAYGATITVPTGWTVVNSLPPEAASKAALDGRRKSGQPVVIFEAEGQPSAGRGILSFIGIALVDQEKVFIPRQFAEKLTPEELDRMAKNLLNRERALAKKKKSKNTLLDIQISRDSINGRLALLQRITAANPDGQPVRLLYWDIYLDDGAGLNARAGCDPEAQGAENEVINAIKSLRVQ